MKNNSTPYSILLVEDSPTQAHHLAMILEDAGHSVKIASHAEEARTILEDSLFDLLLSDVHMPGENGFELCRWVKSNRRFEKMLVVLLTALSNPENLMRGLGAGADYFMTKDRGDVFLVEQVDRLLENQRELTKKQPEKPGETFGNLPESTDNHQIVRILSSAFNDLQRVASELKKSRSDVLSTLQGVLNTIPVGVIISRADGTTRLTNRVARSMLRLENLPPLEKWTDSFDLYFPDGTVLQLEEIPTYQTLSDGASRLEVELVIHRPNEEELPVLVHTQPVFTSDGDLDEVITTFTTISERKRMDELREQLIELDQFAAIGHLASSVAHEINNPATFISANLSITRKNHCQQLRTLVEGMQKLADEEGDPSRKNSLQSLLNSINPLEVIEDLEDTLDENLEGMNRIASTVKNLREFTSTPASAPMGPINLTETLETVLKMADNNLRYRCHVETEFAVTDLWIHAQPARLVQALLKMLLYFANSMDPDITRPPISIQLTDDDGDHAMITISSAHAQFKEEPQSAPLLSRVPTDIKPQLNHLGLEICTEIIQSFRGTLQLHQSAEEPSRIEATFPLLAERDSQR